MGGGFPAAAATSPVAKLLLATSNRHKAELVSRKSLHGEEQRHVPCKQVSLVSSSAEHAHVLDQGIPSTWPSRR